MPSSPKGQLCVFYASTLCTLTRLSVVWHSSDFHTGYPRVSSSAAVQAQGLAPARYFEVDFKAVNQRKAATIATVSDLLDRLGPGAEVCAEAGALAQGPLV